MAAHTQPRRSHGNVGGPETGDWNEFMPRSIKALPVQEASASATRPLSRRSHGLTTNNSACVRASATVLEDVDDPEDRAIGAVKYSQSVMPMAT